MCAKSVESNYYTFWMLGFWLGFSLPANNGPFLGKRLSGVMPRDSEFTVSIRKGCWKKRLSIMLRNNHGPFVDHSEQSTQAQEGGELLRGSALLGPTHIWNSILHFLQTPPRLMPTAVKPHHPTLSHSSITTNCTTTSVLSFSLVNIPFSQSAGPSNPSRRKEN